MIEATLFLFIFLSPICSFEYYVDSSNVQSNQDGSIINAFSTIDQAFSIISSQASSENVTIFIKYSENAYTSNQNLIPIKESVLNLIGFVLLSISISKILIISETSNRPTLYLTNIQFELQLSGVLSVQNVNFKVGNFNSSTSTFYNWGGNLVFQVKNFMNIKRN